MIEFFVVGKPVPKQRPRFVNRAGKVTAFTPRRTKAYQKLVGQEALVARNASKVYSPLKSSVSVTIELFCKTAGDIDNIAKSVLDGLNGVIYEDDRQVSQLICKKCVDDLNGVRIKIDEYKS